MTALTGLNAGQIRVAITGHIWVAPVGSTAPTNVSGAPDAAFQDLGYTDETGVILSATDTFNDVTSWQSSTPTRKVPKSRQVQLKFVLQQMNTISVPLFTSGATVSVGSPTSEYTYSVSDQLVAYERALIIDAADAGISYRFYIPRGTVVAKQDFSIARSKEMSYGLTFEALTPLTGSTLYSVFSNDPNLTS